MSKRSYDYLSEEELESLAYVFQDDELKNISQELRNALDFTNTEILKFLRFIVTGKYQKIKYREIDHLF